MNRVRDTRVARAASIAASEAVSSDRRAAFADRQLIVSTIRAGVASLEGQLGEVLEGMASAGKSIADLTDALQRLEEGQLAQTESLEQIRELLDEGVEQQHAAMGQSASGPSEEMVEELLSRAGDRFAEQLDEAFERQRQAADEASVSGPLLGRDRGLDIVSQQDHLERLRETAPEAALRLEAFVQENGVLRIAQAIRDQELAEGPLGLLVTAARIVAKDGFHQNAEQAYLQASRLDLDDCQKARQLVRAAAMANLQGSVQRFERDLKEARRLCPELPALAIAEARASAQADYMLTRLEDAQSEDRQEQALIHQTRAQAHLSLGDEKRAQEQFDLARTASPDNVSVREFEAILPWLLAQRQIANGEQPDRGALLQAAARFQELATEARREQRPDEAGHLAARAAEALLLAGEHEHAQGVLEEVHDPELLSEEAVIVLGRAALMAQRPDLALAFVPAGSTAGEARLIRGDAESSSNEPQVRTRGTKVLTELLGSTEDDVRLQAAFALTVAAAQHRDVEWNDEAADIVREARPETEIALRAERAYILGDPQEAQRLLLPLSDRVQSLRRLRDYAAAQEDWVAVADRSRELIRRGGGEARDRLALADAQAHLGERVDALATLLSLARSEGVEREMREAAFGGAMQITGEGRDYTAIRNLGREWHETLPESSDGAWNYAFGLTRLQQHDEAYGVLTKAGVQADTVERATLFAEVLHRADLPKADALRRLIELSDRYRREVEALEVLLIATALEGEDDEEPPAELAERVQEAMAHFAERFPESQAIRAIPAPQTPEDFEAFVKEITGDQPRLQQEASDAVRDGRAPVNAIAATSSYGVTETWLRLLALPLGFETAISDDADLSAASDAVGAAAVFDSASLAVLTFLPKEARDAIVAALPGALVSNETLEDAASQNFGGRRPVATTVHDAEGNVGIEPVSADEHARIQERLGEASALAKSLEARPALGEGADEELTRLYEQGEDVPDLRAATASVLLAKRLAKPLYSDDRWIRVLARNVGVPTFGSLALLRALTDTGMISVDLFRHSRADLSARRAWGLALTREELIEEGERAAYDLTPVLIGALNDRAAWRGRPANLCGELAAFLGAAFEARPDRFRIWVRRVIDAGTSAAPEMHPSWISQVLLLMAWGYGGDWAALSDKTFQALVDEIKALPPYLTTLGYDPVMGAIKQLLEHMEEVAAPNRSEIFLLTTRRLRYSDQLRAWELFVTDFPRGAARE